MSCEMPEAYALAVPMARKEHKCCECHGVIAKGEKYHRHSGIWDGEAATYKVCLDCDALRSVVDKNSRYLDEQCPLGGLEESVCEGHDESERAAFRAIKVKRGAGVPEWLQPSEATL